MTKQQLVRCLLCGDGDDRVSRGGNDHDALRLHGRRRCHRRRRRDGRSSVASRRVRAEPLRDVGEVARSFLILEDLVAAVCVSDQLLVA